MENEEVKKCVLVKSLIKKGVLSRPNQVYHGMTCYDVEKSWRGMTGFRSIVDSSRFGGHDHYFLPDDDDTPLFLKTYGRWLGMFSRTKHVVVDDDGNLLMYHFEYNGKPNSECVWASSIDNVVIKNSVNYMVKTCPITYKHEYCSLEPVDEDDRMIMRDMESDDEETRAMAASRRFVNDQENYCKCLDKLSYDPSWLVRSKVIKNPNTSYGTLVRLLDDPDWRVRRKFCERSYLYEMLWENDCLLCRKMCFDIEPEVRIAFSAMAYDIFYGHDIKWFSNTLKWMLDGPADGIQAAVSMLMMGA